MDKILYNKVLKLNRAIHGLKQTSSCVWYRELENLLTDSIYKRSDYESSVFVKRNVGFITIVALYIDYFCIFPTSVRNQIFLNSNLNQSLKLKTWVKLDNVYEGECSESQGEEI